MKEWQRSIATANDADRHAAEGQEGEKRGIFANRGDVYFKDDKDAIRAELIRQIHSEQNDTLRPGTPEQARSLTQAVSLIADVKGLSSTQLDQVLTRLHQHQTPSISGAAHAYAPQGLPENARVAADEWVRNNPRRRQHTKDDAAAICWYRL
jgi:hypothetical protein